MGLKFEDLSEEKKDELRDIMKILVKEYIYSFREDDIRVLYPEDYKKAEDCNLDEEAEKLYDFIHRRGLQLLLE